MLTKFYSMSFSFLPNYISTVIFLFHTVSSISFFNLLSCHKSVLSFPFLVSNFVQLPINEHTHTHNYPATTDHNSSQKPGKVDVCFQRDNSDVKHGWQSLRFQPCNFLWANISSSAPPSPHNIPPWWQKQQWTIGYWHKWSQDTWPQPYEPMDKQMF